MLELASLLLTPLGFCKAAISSVPSLFFFFFLSLGKRKKEAKGKMSFQAAPSESH